MDFSNYLLQCCQALVHSQSISQGNGSRFSNSIPFKTVEEQKLAQIPTQCITNIFIQIFSFEHNRIQDADMRLVLQVYLGLNTLEFNAICR